MKNVRSSPSVSVCIPCYNAELYIESTLQSILNQDFEDFELIVVDDGSTDRTAAILEEFDDPRIHFSRNEHNLGMGNNWNKCLSRIRGKYVKLLGCDDLLDRRCLGRQVQELESSANQSVRLAVCNRMVINSQGRVLHRRKLPFPSGLIPGWQMVRTSIRLGSNFIGEPVVGMFRREFLDQGIRFSTANPYLIDLAFWTDLLRGGGNVFIDKDYLAAFRISNSSVSTRIGLRQADAFRLYIREVMSNGSVPINRFDVLLGYCLSLQWCILRNMVLRFRSGMANGKRSPTPNSAPVSKTKSPNHWGTDSGFALGEGIGHRHTNMKLRV